VEDCFKRIATKKYLVVLLLGSISFYIIFGARGIIPFSIRSVFLITLSFCISYLITPLMCVISRKAGIVDKPEARKIHTSPTPLLGGIAIYLAFGIATIASLWYTVELKGIVYGATIIFFLGLLDDVINLSSIVRLITQVLAVFILFYHGMEIDFIPDFTRYHLIEKMVTIVWIVGITNAVNFLDGMDGLCVGFGAIASFFFGIIAFLTAQYQLMFLAFSLSGSCLGFLPWNFRRNKPAGIFMGDAGSLFIGFTLASFAIMGDWASNRIVAISVPILILFLPIFDTSMTTFFRVREGAVRTVREWLDYVGKDHFHHRLYAIGIGKRNSVWTMYILTAMLGISAIIIRTGGTLEAYLGLIQALVVLVVFTIIIIHAKKRYDTILNKTDREKGIIEF
jgi:UDP-GlcNAc:undecaprenyl-phosphate/decaprenyl-phosphate GlcNAc-1-phosphate transferase